MASDEGLEVCRRRRSPSPRPRPGCRRSPPPGPPAPRPRPRRREAARPKFVLPIDGARLTSGFGGRWGTFHYGIDLAAPMRTPEYAAGDGVVLRAGAASGFGLAVYILHENGDVTVYGHMDEILVEPGQYVDAGETIALLGNRGQSTGPHLHFEVHQGGENGERIDPFPGWPSAASTSDRRLIRRA